MNLKSILISSLLLGLMLLGYWLYSTVPDYGLFRISENKETEVIAVSWSIFWKGLFFLIPSLFVSVSLSLIFLFWAYVKADENDLITALNKKDKMHGHHIDELEKRLTALSKQAKEADKNAKEKYEKQEHQLITKAHEIAKLRDEAIALKKQAAIEIEDADKKRLQADSDVRRAIKKQNNTSGAFNRLKRKQEVVKASGQKNKRD